MRILRMLHHGQDDCATTTMPRWNGPFASKYDRSMVAISTALNARHRSTAKEVFEELCLLGFQEFEVNVHFSAEMVEEAIRLVREGVFRVLSVHNYCPVPDGIERTRGGGDLFHFSSEDPEVREQAVRWTLRSLETADRLGARLLVGHWGIVSLPEAKDIQRRALDKIGRGDADFQETLREALERREEAARPYLERALETFLRIVPKARELGIRLGVENRNYFHEIPSLEEVGDFLAVAPDVAGYWHDIGHAEILELLGVVPRGAFAERWANMALAVHVHDVRLGTDHLPMGEGEVDFRTVLAPFPPDAPWIIESHVGDGETIRRMGEALGGLRRSLFAE